MESKSLTLKQKTIIEAEHCIEFLKSKRRLNKQDKVELIYLIKALKGYVARG